MAHSRRFLPHHRAARALSGLLLPVLLLAGCSWGLRSAQRHFEAGDDAAAATGFESYLRRHPDGAERQRALFLLTLLYQSPDSSVHDPQRAREVLEVLVEEAPGSVYASCIAWSQALERRISELRGELELERQRLVELERGLDTAKEDAAAARAAYDRQQADLEGHLAKMRELEQQLKFVRDRNTDQEERMARLSEALELLKKIDLKRP